MYVVTGGAGFIGSNLVRGLNAAGIDDILVVDDPGRASKADNLAGCTVAGVIGKAELRGLLRRGGLPAPAAVLHHGACADTLSPDSAYLADNNVAFSEELLAFALRTGARFLYASSMAVYGRGRDTREVAANERPVSAYGHSKLRFDQHVRSRLAQAGGTVVGLRYFNVYGPRERHKGRMASMVYQLYRQLSEEGVARLFEGTDGYGAGEQRRDFVYVGDVVRLNLALLSGPPRRGIVNVGTGRSRSFNEVAGALIAVLGRGRVEYRPLDPALRGRYQSFSEADLGGLRALGVSPPAVTLEEGVAASVDVWRAG